MHILTLRPNATIITLIHKAFFHFLPIPRFNDINIQRFPSNVLFLFSLSLSLFHIYLSIYRRPISQSTIYRSFFQSFPISFPRDINLLPWHVVRWRIMHFAKPCPAAGNIGFMRTRYFVIYDQGIIHRGKELRGMGNKIEKKKKNLILWTKPFHFPISSKIRSIRSLSRSDAHVHVFRVDKRRALGTFVLQLSIQYSLSINLQMKMQGAKIDSCRRMSGQERVDIKGKFHEPPATIHLFSYCLNPIIGRARIPIGREWWRMERVVNSGGRYESYFDQFRWK